MHTEHTEALASLVLGPAPVEVCTQQVAQYESEANHHLHHHAEIRLYETVLPLVESEDREHDGVTLKEAQVRLS